PREWDVVGRIQWVHKFLEDIRNASGNSEIIYIEGNHECVINQTLIMTDQGWVEAGDITFNHKVAQVDLNTQKISYCNPLALKTFEAPLVSLKSNMHSELVSDKHSVVYKGQRTKVSELIGQKLSQF